MTSTEQLAMHVRELHFGTNWAWSNLKDTLKDVTWKQATTKVESFNTIATLVFHINYYFDLIIKVLEGGPLDGSDKYSFDLPPIQSQKDWNSLLKKVWSDAERFAELVENLPEDKLWETMADEKYGNYYRNIMGVIEHSHYHLGQIELIKKLL